MGEREGERHAAKVVVNGTRTPNSLSGRSLYVHTLGPLGHRGAQHCTVCTNAIGTGYAGWTLSSRAHSFQCKYIGHYTDLPRLLALCPFSAVCSSRQKSRWPFSHQKVCINYPARPLVVLGGNCTSKKERKKQQQKKKNILKRYEKKILKF